MKRFYSAALAVMLLIGTLSYSPKAEAAVGLILKNRTTLIISAISAGLSGISAGIAALGGGAVAGGGVLLIPTLPIWGSLGFVVFGALGIILLDDNTVLEMSYSPIDVNQPELYRGLSLEEVEVYNSEVEELNAIKKTIQAEITDESSVDDLNALWNSYKNFLSPETVKVAEYKATQVLENLKR